MAVSALSCGQRTPTEAELPIRIVAVPSTEAYLSSPQQERRELLIDGRATDIEWAVTGDPVIALLQGSGIGGDFFASIRALWSYDGISQDSVALYLLVQWADPAPDFLEQPLVTSVDWRNEDGATLIDCDTDDVLTRPSSWTRNTSLHEDQVEIEIYSDVAGSFPADKWRWGAGTTNPATPVNPTEFVGAPDDGDDRGSADHPAGGFAEDFYSTGAGWTRDAGLVTYEDNFSGNAVPLRIASKGTRDTRLNRGKPVSYVVWRSVSAPLLACDSLNPVRLDDAGVRDKSWNPGDYVPSHTLGLPTGSQYDVVVRGNWEAGKWALEARRLLESRDPDVSGVRQPPRPDDVILRTGRTYGIRIRIFNASRTSSSETPILPLYIRPR